MLDIEVAGAVAPGASIVVYFAPNSDQGFLDAITTAIHDTVNQPSVISISWGNPEALWTQQSMQAMDRVFQDAASLGVSVCVAAGDGGSQDGLTDTLLHADFPASSPFVLACGGTHLDATDGVITSEVVWNDAPEGGSTGGGVSDVFDLPLYQFTANVPASANPDGRIGRGVPDVAGDASPATGYIILADGKELVVGGTSAVAPLWSGLIALINQGLDLPVGFLNPWLYVLAPTTPIFKSVDTGNNDDTGNDGPYFAGTPWSACAGWGSPNGANLLAVL
jgi:kumamolisin